LKLEVRDEIRKIQQDIGVTTIIVTHDQEEALAISDKVAILDLGHIQQFDVPSALYNDPGNLFTANFLGNPPMNIIEGGIQNLHGESWFIFLDGMFPILGAHFNQEYPAAKIGVRPSDVYVDEDSPIRAVVRLVEHTGKEKLVKFEMKGSGVGFRMQAPQDLVIHKDEEVGVRFRADRSYFFDSTAEGARIR
jgi:inositol-phosphate transport system ATP-binding protein